MSIKDGTITNKGIVITISNVGNTDQLYDQNYMIDKKENGKWVRLEKNRNNEEFQNDLIAGAKKMNGLSINWEEEYGELSAGKYRITKEFSIDKEVDVEFEIKQKIRIVDKNNKIEKNKRRKVFSLASLEFW